MRWWVRHILLPLLVKPEDFVSSKQLGMIQDHLVLDAVFSLKGLSMSASPEMGSTGCQPASLGLSGVSVASSVPWSQRRCKLFCFHLLLLPSD